uniref:Lin-15A/B-like domain-containing protein n=1 Tax=Caenorhabditis japonica TaxID=281687 RepID=A0A8R1DIQ2_CAEJA
MEKKRTLKKFLKRLKRFDLTCKQEDLCCNDSIVMTEFDCKLWNKLKTKTRKISKWTNQLTRRVRNENHASKAKTEKTKIVAKKYKESILEIYSMKADSCTQYSKHQTEKGNLECNFHIPQLDMSLASSTDTAGPGTSAPITRSQEQPVSIRPMSLRPAGIMRHRPRPVPQQEEVIQSAALTDSRTDALITNFIVGSGLPYEIVNDPIFTELLSYMNPRCVLPTPKLIEACAEKMGNPGKPIVNYQKTQGPLSVTLHVTDTNHKKYLAFSIHYFNETRHRRNVIYLRELLLSKLDENNLLTTLRRAVSAYNYANVKFTNLVVSNDELYALLHRSGVVKRTFVCFYKYVSQFVEKILAFDDFASGLEQLRTFITVVKKDPDAYSKFRRMQLTKNAELDLPALDNSVWESTMVFLTRCLILHETFTEFSERCNIEIYISHAVFNQLVILQRVLQKCVACSRELSTKTSSISQVIPALLGLRSFIASAWGQNSLWKDVREGFTEVFSPLTSGSQAQRYDIATLLDPRYAYNESIYAQQVWTSIEKKLTRDFTVFDRVPNSERNFNVDLSSVGKDERIRILTTEFKLYRQLIIGVRPDDNDDPFSWWSRRSSDLEYLSVFAREFLACPAVSIDADYYFANGGKFSHLCYTYNHQLVENCLNAAGIHQEFRGRGASVDFIQPRQIDQLNTIANRRQKELNIKRFDGVDRSSSKDEYDRLMQSEYPPPPTVSEILKRPKIMDRDLSPSLVVKQELSPDNEVKPMTESNPVFKLTPSELGRGASITERYLAQNRPIKKMFRVVPPENPRQKPQIVQITNPSQLKPTPAEPTKEEKPKDLLNDLELKDIKEEPLDEDDVQAPVSAPVPQPSVQTPKPYSIKVRTPTNTSQISDSSAYLRGGVFTSTPQTRYSNNAAPKPSIASGVTFPKDRPLPQTVAPANFVQKYAQTQKFVQKFVVRKPQIQTLPGSVHELKHNGQNWKKNIFHQSEEKPETLAFYASKPGLPARNSLLRNTFDCFDDFDDSDEEVSHSRDSTFNEVLNRMHSERMYMPQPKKPCNRRCAVCNSMEEHDKLKNVTIDTEKLMIVLGAAYRNEMSIMEARSCLCRVTKTYMCRVHFAEACDEICKMLRVKCPDEIATCTQDRINTALITVVQIRGRSMTVPELRKCLLNFTNKYWEEPAPTRGKNDQQATSDDATRPMETED